MAIDIEIQPGEDLVKMTKQVGIKAMAAKLGFKSGGHMAESVGLTYPLMWHWISFSEHKHQLLNSALWGVILLRNKDNYHLFNLKLGD